MIGYPYIGSMGLELECGIPRAKYTPFVDWASEKYGSKFVASSDPTAGGGGSGYQQGREFLLWSNNFSDLKEFLTKAYGTYGVKTSERSGFHIHFKPNVRKISYDMVKAGLAHRPLQEEFVNKFKQEFRGKPRYLRRLEGEYSRWYYEEENVRRQLEGHGNRYTVINLLSTVEPQHTVEIRVMPGQESNEEAVNTLKWTARTVNGLMEELDTTQKLLKEDRIRLRTSNTEFTPEERAEMEREGIRVRMT